MGQNFSKSVFEFRLSLLLQLCKNNRYFLPLVNKLRAVKFFKPMIAFQ